MDPPVSARELYARFYPPRLTKYYRMEGLPTTEQIDFEIKGNLRVLEEELGVKCE
jgi:hypothetical protein